MTHSYNTKGTCSKNITFDLEDGVVHNVRFTGGCAGNLTAMSKIAEGRSAQEMIDLFRGTTCGARPTSCPDQFALALAEALKTE